VGEVVAAEPLVRHLASEGVRVVISSTTNTGIARARALFEPDHEVVRFPLDFSWMVSRFLDRIRPDAVALLELEVWPHFTRECEARGIPVSVVNGRLSASSFRGYHRLRQLLAPSFRRLAAVGAQSDTYAERFVRMDVPPDRVEVTGTMKWDVELPDDLAARARALRADMGIPADRPVVVAISTGPDEEAQLVEATPEGVTLVVVPRKPERFEEVARLADWIRRSEHRGEVGPSARHATDPLDVPSGAPARASLPERPARDGPFLIDTMGEAEVATALADVVVVGRTFDGLGGSNPIPAAALGKPIVSGPDHHNFAEVTEALAPAIRILGDLSDLPAVFGATDELARMAEAGPRIVTREQGATGRNAAIVRRMLSSRTPR